MLLTFCSNLSKQFVGGDGILSAMTLAVKGYIHEMYMQQLARWRPLVCILRVGANHLILEGGVCYFAN